MPDLHDEVDSDVNEDPKREIMLDRSLDDFMNMTREQVRRKHDITNVPLDSVFEAAEMDEE
ncbi:hypothetical protein KZ483_15715 [Paenibacillus sp. sptzw28]|uniref:hypothetical protein n=1 Tax=Paenibacillus sp. sptzw28 TaxID=715179 RepID=UPI001C6F0C92|nr:hypothetical protein [Paenibacillus sp. sptzw28]QYR19376.1 hypothetical protein KZ483_15715 [Paenibacillus sp. sptzw28]